MIELLKMLKMTDLIDGGGKGKSGPKFEGGGLLSDFANLIATPLGSQQGQGGPSQGGSGGAGGPIMSMPGFSPQPLLEAPRPHAPAYSPPYNPNPSEPPVAGYGEALPSPVTTTALPPANAGPSVMTSLPGAELGSYGAGGEPTWADTARYSGRGEVGMPMQPGMTPAQIEALEWLRANNIRVN
jgi:hypothetical protein